MDTDKAAVEVERFLENNGFIQKGKEKKRVVSYPLYSTVPRIPPHLSHNLSY